MPKSGGVYSKPSGTTFSPSTTIESAKVNTLADDIGSALTGDLPRDGTAAMTADLPMGGNQITGLGTPSASTDGATKAYVDSAVTSATAAEYRVGTTTELIGVDQAWAAMAEVTLTDGASITPDWSLGLNFTVTLGGNRTLANGSNLKVGQSGRIRVVQDGTGSRTLAFGTDYEFAGGSAITVSTAAAAQDILFYDIIAAGRVLMTAVKAIS